MNADTTREFVDTNILIYAYDESAGIKHAIAKAHADRLWSTKNGCVSMQVLSEFYVVGTRKLPLETAQQMRMRIVSYAEWHVHRPTAGDIVQAIDLHRLHQISFWDAMIVHSARSLGCSVLWSEDLNHGQIIAGVEMRNPFLESETV